MSTWAILSVIGVLFWGAWGFLLRVALVKDGDFLGVNAASSLGILAIATPPFLMFQTAPLPAVTLTLVALIVATGLAMGVGQLCYTRALEKGPVAVVVPIYAMSPIVTVILSVAILGETLSFKQIVGVATAIISVIILSVEE